MDIKLPGTPTTLPSPPFVHLHGIPNFRDLGGWPISGKPGKSVRRNFIFRCGEPTRATEEDIKKIQSLGITHVFDLRSNPEIKKLQVAGVSNGVVTSWPGIERVYSPVFPEQEYDPISLAKRHAEYLTDKPEGMQKAYKTIMEQGAKSYGVILRHLLNHPDSAILVHCTAGKDRTGVLCASLLSLAGVSDEVIAEEYHLTEQGLGSWMEAIVGMVMKNHDTTPEAARRMAGARKDSIVAGMKTFRNDYGGVEGYFKDKCGLSDDELSKLRSLLVVDEPPISITTS